MPLLLGVLFLAFSCLQQIIQWQATSIVAIAAETRGKAKKEEENPPSPGSRRLPQTEFTEQRKGGPTETRHEVVENSVPGRIPQSPQMPGESQPLAAESSYIPGMGALFKILPSQQPDWLLILADLLLIILLVERLHALWGSKKQSADTSRCFGALDREMDSVKQTLLQILSSIKTLALQTKVPPATSQELRNPDLANIASSVAKLASDLERLPTRVRDEIVQQLDLRERLRKQEQDKKLKERLQTEFEAGVNELALKFPVLEISSATKHLLSSLQSQTKDYDNVERNYAEYLKLANHWEDLRGLKTKLNENPGRVSEELARKLSDQLKEVQEASEALTKNHRNIWFTVLLDEAARFPSTKDQAERLMDLLSIEEIPVQPGGEIKNRGDIEIARVEGGGDRAFIKEILEKGYLEKKSGQVVKKPKVTVLLG